MNLSSDWVVVGGTDTDEVPTQDYDTSNTNTMMPTSPQNTLVENSLVQPSNPSLAIDTSFVGVLISVLDLSPLDTAARLHPDIFTKSHWQSTPQAIGRISREIEYASQPEPLKFYNLHPIDGSLIFLLGTIEGPPGSPYAGGLFHILIVPRTYPFQPPLFRFLTPIYHPNVDADGNLCLDELQGNWSVCQTLVMILKMITSILDVPLLVDPLVPEIAELYQRDRKTWAANAREWTENFATDVELTSELVERCLELCKMEVLLKEEEE